MVLFPVTVAVLGIALVRRNSNPNRSGARLAEAKRKET